MSKSKFDERLVKLDRSLRDIGRIKTTMKEHIAMFNQMWFELRTGHETMMYELAMIKGMEKQEYTTGYDWVGRAKLAKRNLVELLGEKTAMETIHCLNPVPNSVPVLKETIRGLVDKVDGLERKLDCLEIEKHLGPWQAHLVKLTKWQRFKRWFDKDI